MHRAKLMVSVFSVLALTASAWAAPYPANPADPIPQPGPGKPTKEHTAFLQVDFDNDGDSANDKTISPYTFNTQPGWTPWLLYDGSTAEITYGDFNTWVAFQDNDDFGVNPHFGEQAGVIDRTFSTAQGDVKVVIDAILYQGSDGTGTATDVLPMNPNHNFFGRGRDSGADFAPASGTPEQRETYLDAMYTDFYGVLRNINYGMGRHFIKLELDVSDILANNPEMENPTFEVTAYNYDSIAGSTFGYQNWATGEMLGGLDPSQWLDANWDPNEDPETPEDEPVPVRGYEVVWWGADATITDDGYDGGDREFWPGSYNANPLPVLARIPNSGPWPINAATVVDPLPDNSNLDRTYSLNAEGNPSNDLQATATNPATILWNDPANPYRYAMIADLTADENGMITLYTWADMETFNAVAQGATLLNGFEIGIFDAVLFSDADFNQDGFVDGADFSFFLGEWGSPGGPPFSDADFNTDGEVDGADFSFFLGEWNPAPPGVAFIPEPTTLALLALGGLAMLRRRQS